jgi:Flp pilus assembly protein TadG
MSTAPKANSRAEGRRGLFSRFLRNRSGATAIEFSMLAIPFAALTFAILESCISFTGQQMLSNATDEVARQFRTGQLRKDDPALTADVVRDMICDRIEIMVAQGCPGLQIDLRTYTSFADAAATSFKIVNKQIVLTKNGQLDGDSYKVDPGEAQSINMLRVFYAWPVITDFMRAAMSNLQGGKTLHFAATIWQNEPYE